MAVALLPSSWLSPRLALWGARVFLLIFMPWVRGWVIGRRIVSPGILRRAAWLHPPRVLLRLRWLGRLCCGLRCVLWEALAVAALRRSAREWLQWGHVRTMRGARVALHQSKVPRWSTFQLGHTWDLYGHMARAQPGGRPMLRWKDLAWWEREKQKPKRQRHTHVKYNALADPERQLVAVAGVAWTQVATDLPTWGRLGNALWRCLMSRGQLASRAASLT